MDSLLTLLNLLNSLSPIGVIGLLGYVIYLLVKGKTSADAKVEVIATNHLHDLPEVVQDIREMAQTLRRIEVKQSEEFSYLRAKLNGGSR